MTPSVSDGSDSPSPGGNSLAFRRALARILRQLHRRELLSASPLLDAAFVRRWGVGIGADRLRSAITAGVRVMSANDADREAARLLELAFLAFPRPKQLALAIDLGMGFSTYRRHLARAIDALTDLLLSVPD